MQFTPAASVLIVCRYIGGVHISPAVGQWHLLPRPTASHQKCAVVIREVIFFTCVMIRLQRLTQTAETACLSTSRTAVVLDELSSMGDHLVTAVLEAAGALQKEVLVSTALAATLGEPRCTLLLP